MVNCPNFKQDIRHFCVCGLVHHEFKYWLDANPIPEPMLTQCQLGPYKQTYAKIESEYRHLYENAVENNICKMAAILSRPQYAN